MNASMDITCDKPLHVYADAALDGSPRIFVSILGGFYIAMTAEEARHVRDRLSVVLVEVEDAQKVAETA